MDYKRLSELLFPNVTTTAEDMEKRFPQRDLKEGAKVTRFAPSPTGFVHFGSLFPTMVGERLAHQSGGVFYLRIEDTDAKREVEGAVADIVNTYDKYDIHFDEGATADSEVGNYGPYYQSKRAEIYHTFAKLLVEKGLAYPCFCTEEELNEIRAEQEALKVNTGYYGKWAKYRDCDIETIEAKIKEGIPFVLRFRSTGSIENKIKFTDLIKGTIEVTENDIDHVLLKSDGIPTYHFAHAVDDHLMRTTHVIRGEEWLPSLPFHIQLFSALGFKLPKYLHISQLMKLDENGSKKKLSKRDAGAGVSYYFEQGYPSASVKEYVMTLLNSNFEEWRKANPDADMNTFPFSIKKMSASGSLFDFDKLNDVSKNTIAHMTADEVYLQVTAWAKEFDTELYNDFTANPDYAKKILSIGRGTKKPRKDIAIWRDVKPYVSLFYDDLYEKQCDYPEGFDREDIKKALSLFADRYDENDDVNAWFEKVKNIAQELGFCPETKLYKQNPEAYKGHVGDVSMFIRIALTGKTNSPDMFEVMKIMGREKSLNRIKNEINNI